MSNVLPKPDGTVGDPIAHVDLDGTCRKMVATATGSLDPTYGGRLAVHAEGIFPQFRYEFLSEHANGHPIVASAPVSFCLVEVVGGRMLTDTVVDLGARPLPLA